VVITFPMEVIKILNLVATKTLMEATKTLKEAIKILNLVVAKTLMEVTKIPNYFINFSIYYQSY
jgi:hypothetical protein